MGWSKHLRLEAKLHSQNRLREVERQWRERETGTRCEGDSLGVNEGERGGYWAGSEESASVEGADRVAAERVV